MPVYLTTLIFNNNEAVCVLKGLKIDHILSKMKYGCTCICYHKTKGVLLVI